MNVTKIKKFRLILLLGLFLILSIMAVYPFWKTGYLFSGPDMQFHLSRIEELSQDIQQGGLFSHPIIATHTLNQIGDIAPSVYPDITLYPFAIFLLIMKPVNAIYLGFVLLIFITLILSYYSMLIVTKSKLLAFYFSILYGFTTYIINQTLNFETGTALAYQFIPVAFAGLYMIMRGNYHKWYWLSLGLIGIMYSHAVTTFLIAATFILIYIIYFGKQPKHEHLKRFGYIILACVITILLSVSVWVPILRLIVDQKLSTPNPINLKGGTGSIYHILMTPFQDSGFNDGLGALIILTIILGFIFLNKTPKSSHKFYYFGLISVVFLSKLFPWGFISSTHGLNKIDIIQKTSRVYPICILLLSIYGAYVLRALSEYQVRKNIINVLLILFSLVIISNFNISQLYTNKTRPYVKEDTLPYKATYTQQVPWLSNGGYRVNNRTFYNQFPEDNETGMEDYMPKFASGGPFGDIAMKGATLNRQHFNINQQDIHPNVNRITYHLNMPMTKKTSLSLPILKYNTLKYNVKINGTKVRPYKAKNDTIKIIIPKHISSTADVSVTCMQQYRVWLIIITCLTWIILLLFIFRNKVIKLINFL